VELGGKPYHEGCVPSGTVGGSAGCATCGGELDGECVSTDGLSYHANCFLCATCKQPLKSQFFTFEGKTYCKLCRVTARIDKQATSGEKINAREANRDNQKILGSKIRRADGSFSPPSASTSPPLEAKPAYIPSHVKTNPVPASPGSGGHNASVKSSSVTSVTESSPVSTKPISAIVENSAILGPVGDVPAFCPECGTKSIPGRAFCGECGHKFGSSKVAKAELPSNYEDLQRRFAALKTED